MIKIDKDWVIMVDPDNYTLQKDLHRKDKKGNKLYKTYGYYGKLDNALNAYGEFVNRESLMDGCLTLEETIAIIRKNREEWQKITGVILNDLS